MIQKSRRISYDNRGSALVIALVVSAVLMVLSLSLLAVSYSLFLSLKNNKNGTNEREMFYSAIEVFEQELMDGGHNDLSELSDEELADLKKDDENLFGTQIVYSIYNYCNQNSMLGNTIAWPCLDTERDIEDSSRFFELTCIGSYNIVIQMYWEKIYDVSESGNTYEILLHAIYYLKKGEEIIIQNKRSYRLVDKLKSDVKPNPEDRQGTKIIKFSLITNQSFINKYYKDKTTRYYEVDPDFLPGVDANGNNNGIRISLEEFNDPDFNVYDLFPGIEHDENEQWWHIGSDLNNKEVWDGHPQSLFVKDNGEPDYGATDKWARTNWNNAVPVRLKFIINGYYLDLNIYNYRYIKYIDKTGSQAFTKQQLNDNIKKILLELCGVDENDYSDDNFLDNITWVYKDEADNKYHEFFYGDDPFIEGNYKTIAKTYYVFATFPSYYSGENLIESKIIPFNGNVVDPECVYRTYSFERVIGQ